MNLFRLERPEADHAFIGAWHIYEMELWSASYFNMEVQAYIEVQPNEQGEFQFGLVRGDFGGQLERGARGERFVFTWEGADEMDPALGNGWMRLKGEDEIEGVIAFHGGDHSTFKARRAG